jgi:hypothetical protein
MKKLSQSVENLSTQSWTDSKNEQDSVRPAQVWTRLAQIYGHGLFREHGESPNELWVSAINRLQDSEIATGLKNLAEDALSFPPNLGQFVAACKKVQKRATWGVQNDNMTLLEDHRPSGKMSYAEWKKKEGIV